MSTRCNIKLIDDDSEILLYKHHDGYPDTEHGMVAFLTGYIKSCGFTAKLMADALVETTECQHTENLSGDICYYYEVEPQMGRIKVYEHDMLTEVSNLIDTHDIYKVFSQ
jgi:hypothetical protein